MNNIFSFKKISECSEDEFSQKDIYLTFDIDWASDEVLLDTIEILERADVSATWFVTHATPLLGRLRSNPKFELGVHPNFNFLLNGDFRNGKNVEEILDRLLELVPEAKSIRSHSMTQNSRLMQLFVDRGLAYDCNHFVPEQSGIALKPWILWNGLIKVPHFWEDDAVCIYEKNRPIDHLLKLDGLKVFAFHPIHVFLNTERLERYENTRSYHSDMNELIKYRFEGWGTRSALLQILEAR